MKRKLSAIASRKTARLSEDEQVSSVEVSPTPRIESDDAPTPYYAQLDNETNGEDLDGFEFTPSVSLSKFEPSAENSITLSNNATVCGLVKGNTLVFRGEYYLTVQKGAVTILGATIHASKKRFYVCAPDNATHALPVIECVQVEDLSLADETRNDDNDHLFDSSRAVVLISPVENSAFAAIGKLAPPFKNLWGSQSADVSYELLLEGPESTLLFSSFRSWYDFAYRTLVNDAESAPVILVVGPKSSGKSSFCKFLTNFLLSKSDGAHYMDLDPGQPEYAPPGTLTLSSPKSYNFGPAFSHSTMDEVLKAHNLGYTSPKDRPQLYLSMAMDLFRAYQKTQTTSGNPLIINTPGWTRGLGVTFLEMISSQMSPTVIVSFGPDDSQAELRTSLSGACPGAPFVSLESLLATEASRIFSTKYSPADLRMLQLMAYLHSRHGFTKHLTEIAPYAVPYANDADLTIRGVGILDSEGIERDDVSLCLDGSLVAVLAVDNDLDLTVIPTPEDLPWVESASIDRSLTPEVTRLVGYAVVQSIDTESKEIRLLTPISLKALQKLKGHKLILLRGRLHLPLWELWNPQFDNGTETVPYLSKRNVGSGAQGWRTRRNVLRRGYT